jgi:hypothetical protein
MPSTLVDDPLKEQLQQVQDWMREALNTSIGLKSDEALQILQNMYANTPLLRNSGITDVSVSVDPKDPTMYNVNFILPPALNYLSAEFEFTEQNKAVWKKLRKAFEEP